MLEENQSFNHTEKSYASLKAALEVAKYFVNNPNLNAETIPNIHPSLSSFDARKIAPLFQTFSKTANRDNVLLAGALLYIFSDGHYANELWPDALNIKENTHLAVLKSSYQDFDCTLNKYSSPYYREELNNIIKQFKNDEIMKYIKEEERIPGWVCLFELMYETFVEKYDKYSPKIYVSVLEKYLNKSFHPREGSECFFKEIGAYSISFAGNLDKPGHADCEDFAFIKKFEHAHDAYLAVVNDGVGSATHSDIGSKLAAEALYSVIDNRLERGGYRKKDTKDKYFELMPFFESYFIKEFYNVWEKLIRKELNISKKDNLDMNQFASTMQFAFIAPTKIVVVGKLGDGSLYVRKKENSGPNELEGIFSISDGRSDVLEKSVFSIPLLKNLPNTIHIEFFRREEVKDILITSDGVSPLFKDDLLRAHHIMRDLYNLPYEQRVKELRNIAKRGSDTNSVDFGTGDDASIVYISMKMEG